MKKIILLLLLLAAGVFVLYAYILKPKRPNSFLLITIDTLRADHVSAYGYSSKTTPELDKLASEGVLFQNAFCVMPTTLPSHGSMFFSTWPRIHGSTSNFVHFANSNLTFLPDLLKKAGYATGAVVSAPHLGKNFQQFSSFHDIQFPERERKAEDTLNLARKWLKQNQNPNFFLWIHLWDPHSPYDAHPRFLKKSQPALQVDFPQKYAFLKGQTYTPEQIQTMIDLYDSEIAYTDYHLGRFLEEYRSGVKASNSTIFVTSDHGESLDELVESEGYAFDHGEFLYDHQLHVPLIILNSQLPQQAGKQVPNSVSLMDILPTILKEARIPLPPGVQGSSLSSLMDASPGGRADSLVFLERRDFTSPPMPFLAQRQFGIRERNYKLLYNATDQLSVLYKNGEEGIDVSEREKRLKEMMLLRMKDWLALTSKLGTGQGTPISEEEAEKLRSLGYVQ